MKNKKISKILMLACLSSALPVVAAADVAGDTQVKKTSSVKAPSLNFSGAIAFEVAAISNETTPVADTKDLHNVRVGLAKMFLNASAVGESTSGLIYSANTRLFLDGNKTKIAVLGGTAADPKEISVTEASTIIDRAWLELKGLGFGTFQIGQYVGAHDVMIEDASSVMGGNGAMMSGNWSVYAQLAKGSFASYRQTGDTRASNKVTYYTPRFEGLQLGVSFTPRSDAYGLAKYTVAPLTLETISENAWSGGVNFSKSFPGLDVKLGATGVAATSRDKTGSAQSTQDVLSWELAAHMTAGPLDIAAGFLNNGTSMIAKKVKTTDVDNAKETAGRVYDVAASYTIGAAKVALGMMHTTRALDDGKLATLNAYSLTADYNIEKGLTAYIDLTKFDSTNNDSAADKMTDRSKGSGYVGFVGLNVSF